jgi:hypothetical protein
MAFSTAMTAMASAGEQGIVLDFMRRSFSVNSVSDLAELVVDSTSNFDLENSVQIRGDFETVNHGTSDPMPPLEVELLGRLKDKDRIMSLGKRTIFNYGDVSLLIKNMPEDEDKRGRLRDHLAVLAEAAESRLSTLNVYQQIVQLVEDSNKTLKSIQKIQTLQKNTAMEIMDDVMKSLEESFMSLGLTEDQEGLLLGVVNDGVERSLKNFENGIIIDDKFQEIIHCLKVFSNK